MLKKLGVTRQGLLAVTLVVLGNSLCHKQTEVFQTAAVSTAGTTSQLERADAGVDAEGAPVWVGDFSRADWFSHWQGIENSAWGMENAEVLSTSDGPFATFLRVWFPAQSATPSVARDRNVPLGGMEFRADLGMAPQTGLRLSYHVRFSEEFDFVRGGKLPGLYGGRGNSGGNIPDGTDGFSTRFMWRQRGDGEIYAYLPTSEEYGTSIGQGAWRFVPGRWHHLVQEVRLNQPDRADGHIRVWFDGELVLVEDGILFRSTDDLKLDGLFFSTFFGGGDASWATPRTVHADFANFSVEALEE